MLQEKRNYGKPILVILAIVLGLMGLAMFLQFNPGFWSSPEKIEYLPQQVQDTLGITVPQEAQNTAAWQIPGVRNTAIWVFDLAAPQEGESPETCVRRVFGLDSICRPGNSEITEEQYDVLVDALQELGYGFTHKIFFLKSNFSQVLYCQREDGSLQVALVYSSN